jgi:phytanoyl-CoA hydroxylase
MLNVKKEFTQHKKEFEENGFTIFRKVIDQELLVEANQHIEFLAEKYKGLRPEHYHHPLIRDDAFWVRLVTDDRLLDIAELFLGPDIVNFTAHYICKPPYDGHSVLWHQDGAYWSLQPMKAVSLWLAIDYSGIENGCLKMIPGTHKLPIQRLKVCDDTPNMLYSTADYEVDSSIAIDIILEPGDVSVHNPFIIHGSEANFSPNRRCGLDMGFISASTRITSRNLYLNPILVRGEADVQCTNQYRPWPIFDIENTISFRDCKNWNQLVKKKNQGYGIYPDNTDVMLTTMHMIERLKAGTTSL